MTDLPVTLYDTTLRDGTQGENITLSLADKLRVARMLDEFGFPFIEGGWPGSNPKDIEFFAQARKQRWQTARLAAFGSTRHRANRPEDDPNLRELVAAETPVVTIFGKSWLLHVTEVLGATPQENLDMIADSVAFVADRGREAVYDAEHFFDGYRADRDYALSTFRAARQAGARTLVLCDTNGGTLTGDLVAIVGDVRASLEADPGAPAVVWGIHTHNDAELAVANSIAAVQAGVRHVQATINGYGERCGNANMVSILANLALKTSHELTPAGGGALDGRNGVRDRTLGVVVGVDPDHVGAEGADHARDRFGYLRRQARAVRVAEGHVLGARRDRCLQTAKRVFSVIAIAVEEVLGVVDHALSLRTHIGDRVGDEPQVLVRPRVDDLLQVELPGLAHERAHRRKAIREYSQSRVIARVQVATPCHPEGADHGVVELLFGEKVEKLDLLGVRTRKAGFDVVDPQAVEAVANAQLLRCGQGDALALRPVAKGRVVEVYLSIHARFLNRVAEGRGASGTRSASARRTGNSLRFLDLPR